MTLFKKYFKHHLLLLFILNLSRSDSNLERAVGKVGSKGRKGRRFVSRALSAP